MQKLIITKVIHYLQQQKIMQSITEITTSNQN